MKKKFIFALLFSFVFSAGCTSSFQTVKPSGFAEYEKKGDVYQAISSDGVRIRVFRVNNEPYGDTSMWGESVSIFLKSIGYKELVKKNLDYSKKWVYTEYIYWHFGNNYIYSIALNADQKNIYVIESTGIDSFFNKKRDLVIKFIEGFKLKD